MYSRYGLSKLTIAGAVILSLSATAHAIDMRTFTRFSSGALPAGDEVSFVVYYGGEDGYIETEDSYNNTENAGWYSTTGYCRADSEQVNPPISVTDGDSYRIWVTSEAEEEAGYADGTVTSTSPTFTEPGTFSSPLYLSDDSHLPRPLGFTASPGSGFVHLSWEQVAGATGYRIYRRPVEGNGNVIYQRVRIVTGGSETEWTDYDVEGGETYYYIMFATDDSGRRSAHTDEEESPSYAEPTATPTDPPGPTSTPAATQPDDPAPGSTPTQLPTQKEALELSVDGDSDLFHAGDHITLNYTIRPAIGGFENTPLDGYLGVRLPDGSMLVFDMNMKLRRLPSVSPVARNFSLGDDLSGSFTITIPQSAPTGSYRFLAALANSSYLAAGRIELITDIVESQDFKIERQ